MKIGVLGTGLMGQPMVKRLSEANLSVMAYNRTEDKLESLKQAGIAVTTSPLEIINHCDCLILMLTNSLAIEEVLLSETASKLLANKTIIQMATISPKESRQIQEKIINLGGEYLEAPVLGSIPEVKTGQLLVMVGATESQFQKWFNLFQNFSPKPMLIGEVGTASALKLALNQLITGLTETFALSLGFIQKEGVKTEQFMEILRQSALYAPTFDKKLSRMCDHNYLNPNFPTKHLLKDTDLFLAEAKEIGLDVIGLEAMRQIIQKAIALGFADADYSALFSAINS
jgi:3-hydroxyisobutyrate dehydrogenase